MLVQVHVNNLTEPERAQFDAYLEKKLERIRAFVDAHYPDPDTVKLDVHMKKYDKHRAFDCEFILHMPRTHRPLVSQEVKHSVTEPMDSATAKMEGQLRRHFKKLTRE
jgi:ribosomal subunit interface protein